MYVPAHFRNDDIDGMRAAIAAAPFATLITNGPDGIMASHVPMLLDAEPAPYGTLLCHIARANGQWRSAAGTEALVIFGGPHAYVTPAWYAAKAETGRVVPTWNYVVIHARGSVRVFTDPGELRALVSRLTDVHEASRARPWSTDDAPERFMREQLAGIVGIAISVRQLTGKWKLSQNRPPDDRRRIIAGLASQSDDTARATARTMASLDETDDPAS